MREIRMSGSEGGGANQSSLPTPIESRPFGPAILGHHPKEFLEEFLPSQLTIVVQRFLKSVEQDPGEGLSPKRVCDRVRFRH